MAYHQVPMAEEDKEKTAFSTSSGGLYHYTTMSFGLCKAPATFERTAGRALDGLQWKILVIYIDDIVVYSKTFEQHIEDLKTVLDRMSKAGLKLKPKKCSFFRQETTFLGHVVSKDGIKPDDKKIEVIETLKRPTCLKELRQFLGLTSYYRKFVKNYAQTAEPLYKLTQKNSSWTWESDCETAFRVLKMCLLSAPVLAYPSFEGGEFILDCDSSSFAIGAVLSQIQAGLERVIAYGSRTLSKQE